MLDIEIKTKKKTFQEVPIDLFDHLIEKFNGKIGKSGSSQFAAIETLEHDQGKEYIIIQKKDYGLCHPSFPYTSLNLFLYQPSIFDLVEKGINTFDSEQDGRLKDTLYATISSSRVSKICRYYNLRYELHTPTQSGNVFRQKQLKFLIDYCTNWIDKSILDRHYGFDGSSNQNYDLLDWEEKFSDSFQQDPLFHDFIKELTHNRSFDMSYEDYKTSKSKQI